MLADSLMSAKGSSLIIINLQLCVSSSPADSCVVGLQAACSFLSFSTLPLLVPVCHACSQAGKEPVVGFCFSFAMKQTAVNAGTLLAWTKGFTCSGGYHIPVSIHHPCQ